jgi:hypothetical protein
MPTGTTVNSIASRVAELLGSTDGRRRADNLTDHFERLVSMKEALSAQVRRLGKRPDAAFYLSVGNVRNGSLVVDVRIAGESCGRIQLGAAHSRYFEPRNHEVLWRANPVRLEWRDRRVRRYLEEAAERIKAKSREATVESAFLVELAVSRGAKQPILRRHQPVRLGGLPFQFPLPVSACRGVTLPKGVGAGHADVLARGARGLRVIEVKKPDATDADHALTQAVGYAATLRLLLEESPHIYLPMLGYSPTRRPPRIDAVALVHQRSREKVVRAAQYLGSDNSYFDLHAMLYEFETDTSTGRRRLVITDVLALGKAS